MATGTALPSRGMLTGDVAKMLGIGVQTLYYYEREGLVPSPERSESGYRLYTAEMVERVRFIRKAQALGLPLKQRGALWMGKDDRPLAAVNRQQQRVEVSGGRAQRALQQQVRPAAQAQGGELGAIEVR